ncbi:hypothetical protein [Cellulomonas denverensis]
MMPAEVSDHRATGADGTVLHFQVQARLQGETAATELPQLAITGSQVLGLVALVLGLLLMGWLLLALARRRRCDDCGARVRRGEDWTARRVDGVRQLRCADCTLATERDPVRTG